jgi:ABC-type glycerol-3-phosphate transport system permease component/sugar diacid utilization regulator
MLTKKQKTFNWVLAVFLLLLSIFFLFPVIWMLANSFKPDAAITADMNSVAAFIPPALNGNYFENYITILTDTNFLRYMLNTLGYAALLIVLGVIVNGLAGYALAKINFPFRDQWLLIIMMLLIVPTETVITIHFLIIAKAGLLNTVIGYVLPMIVNPFNIFLFRQVFVSLPDDVYEAAQLDFCSPVKYFFTMVLPMSKTVVATVSVFTFLGVWNDYLWPSLVFTSSDLLTAQIGLNSITSNDNTTMGQTLAVITLITIPVYHNHKMITVIGITGNPDEVRKYAKLAERITRLLIREKELDAFNRTESDKKSYILRGLIDHEDIHPDYLRENLTRWNISEKKSWQLLRLKIHSDDGPVLSASLDTAISRLFQKLDSQLFTFVYPDEYLAVIEDKVFHRQRQILVDFALKYTGTLCIAVGNPSLIHEIADSAFSAEIAMKSMPAGCNYAEASSLDLELILASINSRNKKVFLEKTLDKLSPEDLELLRIYFSCDMSLKKTCEETFLHKNTVQYRLNQIYKKCGYNPREFRDAVRLYLALKM